MNFAIPVVIFVILFAAIVAFQVLAFKSEGKLFWILSFITSALSGIISLITATYYGTVAERLSSQAGLTVDAMSSIADAENQAMVCIILAFVFLASFFFTAIILVARQLIRNKV